ncbi:hypothetical protein Hanom_Chr10g00902131 [Helianthus anomalus]
MTIPADDPTSRTRLHKFSALHLQTATTSATSANPVREGLPVDLPTPRISNVTAGKPCSARLRAMPFIRP